MNEVEKVIIIGSGPAGLTAAIYTSRAELKPLVITGNTPGGQPTLATEVEDYPGFPDSIKAPELAQLFLKQAKKFGARFIFEEVLSVDFKVVPFEIRTNKSTFKAKSVILATGSSPIWLKLPSEKKLMGKGVSSCAICDGGFFRGKKVTVVGGGDTALKEAIFLAKIASEVILIHRRDNFRAQEIYQEQAKSKKNVSFILNSEIVEVLGDQKVSGLKIKNNQNNKISEIKVDGLFVAIGHIPATDFLKGEIELDEKGYVVKKNETETSIQGVFVAGDVADSKYRQIATAVGSGTKAALDLEKYLDILDT